MKKIAVFCSGGGTNFQSIIDAVEAGEIDAEITALVAGKEGIEAIERAKKHGIPHRIFDGHLPDADLIVFAGFLKIVPPDFVKAFPNKIINIHPSLLPKYGGKGMYGLKVHQAVIDNKETVSGCTVHYVDEGTDTGAIIAQKEVPVLPGDTAKTLQARVLAEEHKLLVEVIKEIL